ncbi:MAG: cysteine hydrolase family protein [Gaiellales bacterium]
MPRDALLLIDLFTDFDPSGAGRLAESLVDAAPHIRRAIDHAHTHRLPVIYVSDAGGDWSGERSAFVERAMHSAPAALADLVPTPGDAFLYKPGYSAFRYTALEMVLSEGGVERVMLAGAATEMCITQSAIDARETGLKVTVLRDACAHQDPDLAEISLRYLSEIAGAFVSDVEEWLAESLTGTRR